MGASGIDAGERAVEVLPESMRGPVSMSCLQRIADRVRAGKQHKEIATELGITPGTVATYAWETRRRLGLRSRLKLKTILRQQNGSGSKNPGLHH